MDDYWDFAEQMERELDEFNDAVHNELLVSYYRQALQDMKALYGNGSFVTKRLQSIIDNEPED